VKVNRAPTKDSLIVPVWSTDLTATVLLPLSVSRATLRRSMCCLSPFGSQWAKKASVLVGVACPSWAAT